MNEHFNGYTDMSQKEFSTSQLARELGVYEELIRRLHKRGILSPRRDNFGNRLFSSDDLKRGREYLAGRVQK
ncbi:MAG: MerR family transcriptional regulator [Gammaproteobacteria bacterium]|nr:MerR family transcriptional regulator [Gammaproteobacteria bacterium]